MSRHPTVDAGGLAASMRRGAHKQGKKSASTVEAEMRAAGETKLQEKLDIAAERERATGVGCAACPQTADMSFRPGEEIK